MSIDSSHQGFAIIYPSLFLFQLWIIFLWPVSLNQIASIALKLFHNFNGFMMNLRCKIHGIHFILFLNLASVCLICSVFFSICRNQAAGCFRFNLFPLIIFLYFLNFCHQLLVLSFQLLIYSLLFSNVFLDFCHHLFDLFDNLFLGPVFSFKSHLFNWYVAMTVDLITFWNLLGNLFLQIF